MLPYTKRYFEELIRTGTIKEVRLRDYIFHCLGACRDGSSAVNILLVERNWLLGERISEEFMSGNGQDRYGKQIISELSEILDKQTSANIFHCFYQAEDLLSCVPKILCCCILIHRFLQCADSTKNWEIRVYSM